MHALLLAQAASRVAAVDNSIAWHTVAIERSTSGSVLMMSATVEHKRPTSGELTRTRVL
jgi:hypothetical protein